MIEYSQSLEGLSEDMLEGFFSGWPNPPSKQTHMEILNGSYSFWLAVDRTLSKVVGYITALSDGVISAYIPLLGKR